MNMDESGKAVDVQKRLTMLQNEKHRNEMEKLGFTPDEHENINEFFNRELKKSDAKAIFRTIEFMFKDISNERLKKYFVDSITKYVKTKIN